ncbi:threonine/serine dehydratase [Pikeienuella piscinae]|uniref:Threonine/serine dehydratase n=1 Tax=Pikeienuella piscinae TaxID=2748098 RepID=A0A7M3T563_9RHOB|nr:threonine/serine dehydratase [Pikeienuella piscinae]QIE57144.1 threonine/serine dehydratase [Pikeienuella piscinae]
MTDSVGIAEIRAAARRLEGAARVTPLLESDTLNVIAGRRVLVKAECLQRTGSFKFRGGWSALSALDPAARAKGVIAFSSGNHAQGVALAAKLHGAPAVIIMPSDAPQAKIAGARGYGAEIVLYDRRSEDRDALGATLAAERGLTPIKPFDEPMVIAGQGTCGLEIAAQTAAVGVAEADVVICCGGGGFTAGAALALEAAAPRLRVRPAEPAGFDDAARSLRSGRRERNDGVGSSICDAILTPQPGELTFPVMRRLCGPGLVVGDEEARCAMATAWKHLKIVAEPGGAVALASVLFRREEIEGDAVICTVSGGNVDPGVFAAALSDYGDAP